MTREVSGTWTGLVRGSRAGVLGAISGAMEGAASMLRNIDEEARPRRCDKTSKAAATIVSVTSLVSNRCSNFVHHSRDSRGTC